MNPQQPRQGQLSLGLEGQQPSHEMAATLLQSLGIVVRYVDSQEGVDAAIAEIQGASGPIGLDLETAPLPAYAGDPRAGLDPLRSRIRLAQFYAGATNCWVVDVDKVGSSALAPFMELTLVAHNASFEMVHLLASGLEPKHLGCTLLADNALRGGMTSLADLAKRKLEWNLEKELQLSDWNASQLDESQLAYAALDAVAVRYLAMAMAAELRGSSARPAYQLMRDALPAVARLELAGIAFDLESHEDLIQRWQDALETAQDELRLLLGPHLDPASPTQLGSWLAENLDTQTLEEWPRTKTGRLRTAAAILSRHPDHPLVAPLLAHKDAAGRLASFGPAFREWIHPETGRIHAHYRLGATPSGRMAAMRPNMQNPPREQAFRALFKAPEGRSMIVADYSQIELRVAALVANDTRMLEAYARGEDLHRATAAAITGLSLTEISPEQRQLAKAVNFGLLFGQGARGLAAYARSSYGVAMSEAEAKAARQAFFDAWPELAAWQRQTGRSAERNGYVTTPAGRRIDLRRGGREVHYTEALNVPIQGGAAEVLMAALAYLLPILRSGRAVLVNVVHDELVLEADAKEAQDVSLEVEEAMIAAMLNIFPEAPTVDLVDAGIGPSWADAK